MTTQAKHRPAPLERLRHHVSGAIARGESAPVVGIPAVYPAANHARKASDAYAQNTKQRGEDDETLLSGLLADCLHLLGPDVVARCMSTGSMHYKAEARGED